MSYLLTLRRLPSLPRWIETDNGEPKKAHWVGSRSSSGEQQERQEPAQKGGSSRPSGTRGYRDLASITLGEVQAAFDLFENQLLPSPYPAWVATNMFCLFEISQRRDEYRPAAIFGRVQTSYPNDGYIDNIQVIELLFPHRDGTPYIVLLRNEDVDASRPVQSYGLRVRFLASSEELEEFRPSERLILEQGLIPEFSADFIDLLHLREQDRNSHPWFYVVGSRWFASIPESVKPEVRDSLKNLVTWNKQVFNYHPRSLEPEIRNLNWELEFNYNFTEHFLTSPETPADTVKILAASFEKMLQQPIV
jgi:hypothetical protein